MWFLGLLAGGLFGALFGFQAALAGALLGLIGGIAVGRLLPADEAPAPGPTPALEQRLQTLEAQVAWLHRETPRLRTELAAGQGEAPEAEPAMPPTAEAEAPASEATAPFIDDTPTQPGDDAAAAAPAGAEPAPAPEAATRVPPEPVPPSLGQRLLAGNILAKIGVVLLFFGMASALRLAADYGYLPVPLRLLLGAVAGLAMIAFGWTRVRAGSHQAFGIVIQGGGFAILYLIVYFMLARYQMLGTTPSFALFALLGVACVLLSAAQDGVVLAVFGLAGAFAAPVLASSGSGEPLPLFAYFTLLNAFIVGVSWFKTWRVLNVTGFLFTLGVGLAWAVDHYHAGHHDLTQGFLIFFWVLYAAAPVAMALFRAPGWAGWSDATLVFGTPLVAFALQSQLAADRYELAWDALGAALGYGALWAGLFRRGEAETRLLERCQLGLAIAFATLAVPLAFGVQVTAAFWALEGAAVLWFGVAQGRRLAMATGALLQVAAGVYFLTGVADRGLLLPVINDRCLGTVLIAATGYASARLLRRRGEGAASLALFWAIAWWFLAGAQEIDRLTVASLGTPLTLVYVALSLLALDSVGRRAHWPAPRQLSLLLLPALWLAAGLTLERSQHLLAGLMVLALPLAGAIHHGLLARQEADGEALWPGLRHVGAFWLVMGLVSVELAWVGRELAPGVSLWSLLAWPTGPLLGLWAAAQGNRRELPPVAGQRFAYLGVGCLLPALLLALWVLWANFGHAGGGSGLPYVPLLNPFDLVQWAAMAALYAWLRELRADPLAGLPTPRPQWVGALAFVWISGLAARIAHHWGGVPFDPHALWQSTLVQAMLTLLWTALAIAAMIGAARIGGRRLWQGGFALLAVVGVKLMFIDLANAGTLVWTGSLIGVALLVLAAGYFAPAPPAAGGGEEKAQ